MAVNQTAGKARVTRPGLTVNKALVPGDGGLLQVWYEFESTVNQRLSVRIVDELPDAVERADVGFRPVHSGDQWTLHPDKVWFEDTLEPKETIKTVYAVRNADAETASALRGSPTIDTLDVVADGFGNRG